MRPMSWLRRHWPWAAAAVFLLALYLTTVSSEMGGHLGGDSITYYLLGQSITQGRYVDLYLPDEPVHRKYPFLFPLLLAPFLLVFDKPLLPMHIMVEFFWAASFVLFGLFLQRRLGDRRRALALALMAGMLPRFYSQGTHLLTEAPFMAFVYAALLLTEGPRETSDEKKSAADPRPSARPIGTGRLLGLIALSLCAYYTRTAALALGAAITAALFLERPRVGRLPAWLVYGAAFGLGAAGWWAFANRGGGLAYIGEFMSSDPYDVTAGRLSGGALVIRLINNAIYHLPLLGIYAVAPLAFWSDNESLTALVGGVFCLIILLGLAREFRRRPRRSAEWFFVSSLGIILLWPFQEDRFVLPVIPLALFYLFSALEWAAIKLGPTRQARALTAAFVLLMIPQLFLLGRDVPLRLRSDLHPHQPVQIGGIHTTWRTPVVDWNKYDWNYERGTPEQRETLDSMTNYLIINYVIASVAPADAVILSRKPMITYFLSGRKSVPIIADPDPAFQWEYIQKNQVSYLVTGIDEAVLTPVFQEVPKRFKPVAGIDDLTMVYRILRRHQPLPPEGEPDL